MPMAMAPEGIIIKLVEDVREGTRINSRLIIIRGATATFMFLR